MVRQPLSAAPPVHLVGRITFVPFIEGGACALVQASSGDLRLPSGEVDDGEHYLDAAIRIPLETAGFRMQRFHPFAADGAHLFAWVEGDRYGGGSHAYRETDLLVLAPEEAAEALRSGGHADDAAVIEEGTASYRGQSEASYYADNLRMLERAYLRASTPEGGSGFGRDSEAWRAARQHIVDGIDRDGSFLDVGCANGLLLESVAAWAAARGFAIEPYGLDFAPGLVDLARRRLPQWKSRLWVGNAIDWTPPDGRRFDFVHTLLDLVPANRRRQMLQHHLNGLVAPGGRLLVSGYGSSSDKPTAADIVCELGLVVTGHSRPSDPRFASRATTAWIEA